MKSQLSIASFSRVDCRRMDGDAKATGCCKRKKMPLRDVLDGLADFLSTPFCYRNEKHFAGKFLGALAQTKRAARDEWL